MFLFCDSKDVIIDSCSKNTLSKKNLLEIFSTKLLEDLRLSKIDGIYSYICYPLNVECYNNCQVGDSLNENQTKEVIHKIISKEAVSQLIVELEKKPGINLLEEGDKQDSLWFNLHVSYFDVCEGEDLLHNFHFKLINDNYKLISIGCLSGSEDY